MAPGSWQAPVTESPVNSLPWTDCRGSAFLVCDSASLEALTDRLRSL